jgi:Domain of unknown function (DUF4349)
MRPLDEQPLDPEVVASLEVIDATLAGEPVAPLHAELAELSLLLADERPAIDPAFAHTLDERVRARFPDRKDRRPASGGWLRRRWAWVASGAVAAAAVAVIVVLVASSGGRNTVFTDALKPSAGSSSSESSAASTAASSAGSSAASSAAPLPGPSTGHKLIQSAQLALTTPPDHVDDVAQEVFDVVGQQNGFVVRSSVTQTGDADGSASLQLSVPSASLPETMAKLSGLRYARVSSRTDNSQDVNNQYGQATRRLADARALHTALLKQFAGATTTEQVDSLHAQIRDSERAISRDESSLAALKHRIAYSSVSLTITARPRPAGTPTHHGGGFTLGRAARDAGHMLTVAAGVALIGLAALIPVALVVGLAWLLAGLFTHRRRERALDLA